MDSISNRFNIARNQGRKSRPMELQRVDMPAPPTPDTSGGLAGAIDNFTSGYKTGLKNRGSDLAPKTSPRPRANPRY